MVEVKIIKEGYIYPVGKILNVSKQELGEALKEKIVVEIDKYGNEVLAEKMVEEEPIDFEKTIDSLKEKRFDESIESLSNVREWECEECSSTISLKKGKKPNYCECTPEGKTGKRKYTWKLIKKKAAFDYYAKKPLEEITSLEQVEKIIKKNFPTIWPETKACISTAAQLSIKNLNGCPALIKVGNPSGEKTTIDSFFYGQNETYMSDDFTPRAFVSHASNVSEDKLEDVDLLPRIKNKILITPELAPLFEAPKDKLIDNFATLTRVLDGEGLNRDSGTHGHRGYSGDYKFIWLGSTTPLKAHIWNIMGKIGNRLFFLNMNDKKRSNDDYLEMFTGRAYDEKIKECRGVIRSFLDNFFKQNPIRSLGWDAEGDILLLPEIIKYAKLLSKLRGSLMLWKSEEQQGKYEFNFPVIEEPPRAINALYNFAKGHALIHGRTFLKKEDLEIVKAIAFSSMPHDRHEFLKLLAKHEGRLTTSQIQNELNCSDETARKTMNVFKILGIVDIKSIDVDYSGTGRPMSYIEVKDEFKELLEHTQGLNDLENNKPSEIKGVSVSYDDVKPEDFVKRLEKKIDTHPLNNLEKSFPSKITPVRDKKEDNLEEELKEVFENE